MNVRTQRRHPREYREGQRPTVRRSTIVDLEECLSALEQERARLVIRRMELVAEEQALVLAMMALDADVRVLQP